MESRDTKVCVILIRKIIEVVFDLKVASPGWREFLERSLSNFAREELVKKGCGKA